MFPDAVICLESALDYYGYTERTPSAWNLAIPYKSARNRFYIEFSVVKPHFVREDKYRIGISYVEIDNTQIMIYDRERTMCDLMLHKNKTDTEVFNKAVRSYISDPMKKTDRLILYARQLRVERKVREILGIWL